MPLQGRTVTTRTLRVPCASLAMAAAAEAYLRDEELIDVTGIDGRHLLVPAGWSPVFVWNLAEALEPYGHDDELAQWASTAASARPDDDPGAIRNRQPATTHRADG